MDLKERKALRRRITMANNGETERAIRSALAILEEDIRNLNKMLDELSKEYIIKLSSDDRHWVVRSRITRPVAIFMDDYKAKPALTGSLAAIALQGFAAGCMMAWAGMS